MLKFELTVILGRTQCQQYCSNQEHAEFLHLGDVVVVAVVFVVVNSSW
jgi:hypothetical protein